jgi:Tfp pilus assembly protein PilZ
MECRLKALTPGGGRGRSRRGGIGIQSKDALENSGVRSRIETVQVEMCGLQINQNW